MNDYTQTPNLGLYKPEVNADYDLWGDHLNANADILDGVLKATAVLSDTAPAQPRAGDLWFDTVNAQLYVWDVDPTSSQWVIATAQNSAALVSDLPPATPTKGQFWFDSTSAQLFVWYVDPTGPGQWVPASVSPGGGMTEAPTDGAVYGRKGSTSAWVPALPLIGGTLTGPLTLPGNATLPLQAVPLQQIPAPGLPLTGGTVSGNLTLNGKLSQTFTNTQPTADFIYNLFNNVVNYTANGTGGDSLGLVGYMQVEANGHSVPDTASQHTAGIYGNASLITPGTVDTVNGGMFVAGNSSTGTLTNAVAVRGHPNYNTGGGIITNHYFLYEEPSSAAQHHYNYLSAPVGIGVSNPTYNLEIRGASSGGNMTANWMRVGDLATGNFTVSATGASIYPGFNPGAGGFGCQDLVVGFNGAQNTTTATSAFLFLSSCAGMPTGVPTAAAIGRVPITVNTTANTLNHYVNGAWRESALTSALAGYLPLAAGGTITGATSFTAQANFTGSPFAVNISLGQLLMQSPFAGSTPQILLSNTGTVSTAWPTIIFDKHVTGGLANLISSHVDGVNRWQMLIGDNTAEGGSNAGSNFQLQRFADGGGALSTVLTIIRSSGLASWSNDMGIAGVLTVTGQTNCGALATGAPAGKSGAAYTVAATDYSLLLTPTGTFTLTLPTAAAPNVGRILVLKLLAAFAVNSASSNVVPLAGGVPGTAIMTATAGKFCMLQSDGGNWQIMAAN